MIRFRSFLPLIAAVLVGTAMLGAPRQASATLAIYLQEVGVDGAPVLVASTGSDFTATSFTGTHSDFAVSILGGVSDNGATMSDLLSSTTAVKNNAASTKTLLIFVTQDNYTLPAGTSLVVESGMAGTVNTGTLTLTNLFQAYADKNNALLGTTDFTNGPQTATQTGSTFDTGSATGLFTRVGNFSLTSLATITLTAGGRINFANHINVTPVPEPSGLVMALAGLPVLGLGTWLRRRRMAGITG